MSRVCVLLAEGFEEIEAVTIIDVLRRAGVEVVTLGVSGEEVRGSHDIRVHADAPLESAPESDWDMVILPGGLPGSTRLRDDPGVQKLIRDQDARRRGLAAICAAPMALSAAGALRGRRATSYPGVELEGADYREESVVADGHVITSRGVGTALEFALRLVEELEGEDAARTQRERMLVRD